MLTIVLNALGIQRSLQFLGINGGYSRWSAPGRCTQTCGGGVRLKSRKCNSPKPSLNGKDCDGPDKKVAAAKWCNIEVYITKIYFRQFPKKF